MVNMIQGRRLTGGAEAPSVVQWNHTFTLYFEGGLSGSRLRR